MRRRKTRFAGFQPGLLSEGSSASALIAGAATRNLYLLMSSTAA
jgi:hypothetical protein